MVIVVEVTSYTVMKTLVDQGSSMDVIFLKTFKKLSLPSEVIVLFDEHIVSFSSDRVDTRGYVNLYTSQGIEANPDKCKALKQMRSPQNLKKLTQHTDSKNIERKTDMDINY